MVLNLDVLILFIKHKIILVVINLNAKMTNLKLLLKDSNMNVPKKVMLLKLMKILKLFVQILKIFVLNFLKNVIMIVVLMVFVHLANYVNVIIFIKDQLVQKNKNVIIMMQLYVLN